MTVERIDKQTKRRVRGSGVRNHATNSGKIAHSHVVSEAILGISLSGDLRQTVDVLEDPLDHFFRD